MEGSIERKTGHVHTFKKLSTFVYRFTFKIISIGFFFLITFA